MERVKQNPIDSHSLRSGFIEGQNCRAAQPQVHAIHTESVLLFYYFRYWSVEKSSNVFTVVCGCNANRLPAKKQLIRKPSANIKSNGIYFALDSHRHHYSITMCASECVCLESNHGNILLSEMGSPTIPSTFVAKALKLNVLTWCTVTFWLIMAPWWVPFRLLLLKLGKCCFVIVSSSS